VFILNDISQNCGAASIGAFLLAIMGRRKFYVYLKPYLDKITFTIKIHRYINIIQQRENEKN